ncbi:MAG: RNA 2',3'-cyclic phosphodiesterase [Coriobacteriales bacterium]|jgi:2'-5' RNA ligase|nr:RNA 2',3'-cyclic phosphodiesterase [Coriobacteriales bacterium]
MRLFVALELAEDVKDTLAFAAADLTRQAQSGRAVMRDNFHLTLVFIGETNRIHEARTIFEETGRQRFVQSLKLTLRGIGTFKGKKTSGQKGQTPTTVYTWWIAVEPTSALLSLTHALTEAYRVHGFTLQSRNFKPHITLVRGVCAPKPIEFDPPCLTTISARLSLMKSDLTGRSPVYTTLASRQISEPTF